MKTLFYERTAYKLSEQPVPDCFIQLDNLFDQHFETPNQAFATRSFLFAESLCARMADVEMYAFLMLDIRSRQDEREREQQPFRNLSNEQHATRRRTFDTHGAILTRSFFLGYLGACRALLGIAGSILATLYELDLEPREQCLDNGLFWEQLVVVSPTVYRRYHAMRVFFNDVMRWERETPYRVPPISLLQPHKEALGDYSYAEMQIKVIDEPEVNLKRLLQEPTLERRVDPLDLHRAWKPDMLQLCRKLCRDLQEVSFS